MNELKFYKYLVILLVLINFGVLIFFVVMRPGPPPHMGPPHPPMHEKLQFKGEKESQFRNLEEQHHQAKRKLMEERHKNYVLIGEDIGKNKVNRDSILKVIADIQFRTDKMTFDFFEKVYGMCDDNQKKHLHDMLKHGLPGPPKPPPPGRR